MGAFLDSVGLNQALSIGTIGTKVRSFDEIGIVNHNGTMDITRRLYGKIVEAYTCPKPRKCYAKKGELIWKKVPAKEARREAALWTTKITRVYMLPEDGTYTIVGNIFTYEYTADGVHRKEEFGFLLDGYGLLKRYSYPDRGTGTEYLDWTIVKKSQQRKSSIIHQNGKIFTAREVSHYNFLA